MDSKKQTFTKPEADVIKFEKNDVIATSPTTINEVIVGSDEPIGGDCALLEG